MNIKQEKKILPIKSQNSTLAIKEFVICFFLFDMMEYDYFLWCKILSTPTTLSGQYAYFFFDVAYGFFYFYLSRSYQLGMEGS